MKRSVAALSAVLAAALAVIGSAEAAQAAAPKTILIGEQCDRTGATQITGVALCPAVKDYIDLVNSEGGVDGWTLKVDEIDNQYKVPLAVEAYQREKGEGAVVMMPYGTPMIEALYKRLDQDKIPATTPGFGIAAAADGMRFPYVFPIAATYWSQAAAAVQFAKDQLGGSLKGKKIAYIYYDNPAGREPLPVLDALKKIEGFTLETYAVPPPGVDVSAQILEITQRYRPDFVIDHLFGKAPALAIKGFKQNDYPLSHVVGLVWASSEADIDAAGGFGIAQGYNAMQFAGAGDNYPVRQQIKAMYKKEGRTPVKFMDSNTVYYNRGLFQAAMIVQAIRNALQSTHGQKPTGTDIKKGFEQIHDFTLGGLVPPLTITPQDHEGGGWVQIFQVKGDKLVPETKWFRAYRGVVKTVLAKVSG
ncbi:MAG TPA: ABC transporter substrate-binding protein [Stellaceae bacterium]|nr:ABC transporter substrate-binding protein [Stellaceae bacterium]